MDFSAMLIDLAAACDKHLLMCTGAGACSVSGHNIDFESTQF
jgi:hypothetical protein